MRYFVLTLAFLVLSFKLLAGEGIAYPDVNKVFLKAGFLKRSNPNSYDNFALFCQKLIKTERSKKRVYAINYVLDLLESSKESDNTVQKELLYSRAQRALYPILAKVAPKPVPPTPSYFYKQLLLHPDYIPGKPLVGGSGELDVTRDNPWWHIESKKSSWRDLELLAESLITDRVKKRYEISKQRKVLFFNKIGHSGTSPKVKAFDSMGIKWKIKWGSEVQTEPVANRLYLALGGKYTDLVYANKRGAKGLTLILNKHGKKQECGKNISSVDYLRHCFLNSSPYKFELIPFIYKKGVITESNLVRVLKYLPGIKDKDFQRGSLIGREYITFKESSVELIDRTHLKRVGPATTNLLGGDNDRATKGLFLFNLFIWNSDAKEDNNRAQFVENFNSRSNDYVEFQHDMGASFGPPALPGTINDLSIGDNFLKKELSTNRYIFNEKFIYFPRSWKNSGYFDLLWFAKKIVSLKNREIRNIVDATEWPNHIKDVFTYRLIKRRDRIGEVFGLTSLIDSMEQKAISIKIDFSTKKRQIEIANRFGLNVKKFLKIVAKHKLKSDTISDNGLITPCSSSLINNLLERELFPSGLTRRLSRKVDNQPLARCRYSQ